MIAPQFGAGPRLLLQDWDRSRGAFRKTKYGRFDPDIKLDFLSALSFELTYKVKAKRFSEKMLIDCYRNICKKFNLPEEESTEVVREIETHTGIIIETGGFSYEFSHLSLQEFLCANYIVREPFSAQLGRYIREYSDPLAVSVAISAEPSTWLAGLVLTYGFTFNTRTLRAFIARLLLENPSFVESVVLGYATLNLFFSYYEAETEVREQLELFARLPTVFKSLSLCLPAYRIIKDKSEESDFFYMTRQYEIQDLSVGNDSAFGRPAGGSLPKKLLLDAIRTYNLRMWWGNSTDEMGYRFDVTAKGYSYAGLSDDLSDQTY